MRRRKSSLASRFVRLISPTKKADATSIETLKKKESDNDNNMKDVPPNCRTVNSDSSSTCSEKDNKKRVSFAPTPEAVQQRVFWDEGLPGDETDENDQLVIFERENDGDDKDSFCDDMDDEDDYVLDDLSEIISVSTAGTLTSHSKAECEEEINLGTIGAGKMFFFVQKGITLPGGETNLGTASTINAGPKPIKEKDSEDLIAKGRMLYEDGEKLLAAGKVKKARNILSKAKRIQKKAIALLAQSLAKSMYEEARKLCVQKHGENVHLATVLFGCSEILKQNPSPQNILMATKVHLRCRNEGQKFSSELDDMVRELGNQAKLIALTMQAYATTVSLVGKRKRKKNKQKDDQRQPQTILEDK